MKVMVLGSGFGKTAFHIAEAYGCKVFALEASKMLTGRRMGEMGLRRVQGRVQFVPMNGTKCLPITNVFDVIIAESVLNFFADKKGFVEQLAERLKSRGRLVMAELVWALANIPEASKARVNYYFGKQVSIETPEALIEILRASGMVLLNTYLMPISFRKKFLDDGRAEKLHILPSIGKTLVAAFTNPQARRLTYDFLAFYRLYPSTLSLALYLCEKPA